MKSPENKPLPENIERLIAKEETAAMSRFRARDFSARVKRAVAADRTPAPSRAGDRRVPGWAWTAAALFVAAGILAYVAVPKRVPIGGADGSARAVAIRLPGLDGLEAWARDTALEPAPASPAVGGFAAAFAGMGVGTAAEEPGTFAPTDRKIPRLGLEKLMEILIRDRAVEKALSLMSPKFKEG